MNEIDDPYRAPAAPIVKASGTGLVGLFGGLLVFVICVFLVGYLMLRVVPDVKESFAERGAQFPNGLQLAVGLSDHFVSNWYLWIGGMVGTIGLTELFFRGQRKRQLRNVIAIGISLPSLAFLGWLALSTLSALP